MTSGCLRRWLAAAGALEGWGGGGGHTERARVRRLQKASHHRPACQGACVRSLMHSQVLSLTGPFLCEGKGFSCVQPDVKHPKTKTGRNSKAGFDCFADTDRSYTLHYPWISDWVYK